MKAIFTSTLLGLAFLSSPLLAQNGQPNQAEVQALSKKFQQLLGQQLQFKDPEAMAIMKQIQENGGKLPMTFPKMQQLVKKWSANSPAVKFQDLFKKRLAKKDPSAVALMEEAQANQGKMSLTPAKMKELVAQWEAAENGAEPQEDLKDKEPKEKAPAVKSTFDTLFEKRIAAKDESALALQLKKAKNGGKLNLSAARKKALIEQWEVAEAMEAMK